jgi:hypothetical protein
MSFNTGTCCVPNTILASTFTLLNTPLVAENASQLITQAQNQTGWVYVSTIQSAKPNYVYQYKSQTERIQAKMGRLSLNQC